MEVLVESILNIIMNVIKRCVAFLIDMLICCLIVVLFLIPIFIALSYIFFGELVIEFLSNMYSISFFTLLLFKDVILKGFSIGKKILKLKIITDGNKQSPKKVILIFRNIFVFIWQIDFIVLLVSGKKVEDWFFKTNVVSMT